MDLVCFSHLRWDFVYQRPQHLLSRFVSGYRVIYIQEFTDGGEEDGYELEQSPEQVWVVSPQLARGGDNHVERQRRVVDSLFSTLEIREYILWYYTPMSMLFSDHLQPLVTVYDCMDELASFKFADPRLRESEQQLFGRADLVFTGGNSLYEAKKQQHPNVYSFASSIDKGHFSIARAALPEPADQAQVPHPRLGFYGVIDERFDIGLIAGAARLRPDWHFILLGPVVKIDPAELPRMDNIHYLGSKTYKELPGYLSGWDIALIPFAINESTRYISPTKTPEYLAAGKPVISTPITDVVEPYGKKGLVEIVERPEELVASAEMELKRADRQEWLTRVDDHLSTISWDITWSRMSELITSQLYKNQHSTTEKTPTYV
jgi:glycosyltransferase involved in cell wall biosynthesis